MQTSIADSFPSEQEWTQWNIDQQTILWRSTLPDLNQVPNYRHGQQAGINSSYKNKKPVGYDKWCKIDRMNYRHNLKNKEIK